MAFRVTIAAPGEGIVADFLEDAAAVYADGWNAARVSALLSESASVWRASQVYDGGVDCLDEERVTAMEAARDFFALIALGERREYVDLDALTDAIARLSRAGDGVILESIYDQAGDT